MRRLFPLALLASRLLVATLMMLLLAVAPGNTRVTARLRPDSA